jgi:ATP phosphoribosyltransferase regulatory subunit
MEVKIKLNKIKYLLPEESKGITLKNVSKLRSAENSLRDIFVKYGYQEALMPSFEYTELYKLLDSSFNENKCFQFINREGKSISLCCDFTIPLARYYISQNSNEIARYCYFGKVHRKEELYKGKNSDFLQAGFELINLKEIEGEKECLHILEDTLNELDLGDLIIEIGSAEFFKRICEITGNEEEIKEILIKKNISAMQKFVNNNNIDENIKKLLLLLPRTCGNAEILENIKSLINDKELKLTVDEMIELYDEIKNKNRIIFDLGMVPTMDYYTGMMFKVYSKYSPEAIVSGGRYDSLLAKLGKDVPAIGAGYYLNNILKAIERSGDYDD